MSHLQTILERWAVEYVAEPEKYERAYSNDLNVFSTYLANVYGFMNSRRVFDGSPYADVILEATALLPEVLRFPVWTGLDPKSAETAEWALFAVQRAVEIHPDIYAPTGRFERQSDVLALLAAGVPLDYAKALDITRWSEEYPVTAVIRSYEDGLAPEYARTLVYGARES